MIRIFLLTLFAGLSICLQAQEELIPRELLFQAKEKTNVQLAKSGQQVFYQKSAGDPQTIYYVGMPNLRKEQSVRFDAPVLDWVCTYNDGLLVILEQSGSHKMVFWSGKTEEHRDVPLLDSALYQIVDMSPRLKNKIAISGRSLKDEQNGVYLIDLYGKSVTKKILDDEGFAGMRFDFMFNPVAAWRRNAQGGNSIFLRKGYDWEAIAEFPFDESQFLGGFQQVISVTGDGRSVYYTDNLDRDKTVLMQYDIASGTKTVVAEDNQADILPFGAIVNKKGVPGMVLGVFAKAKRYYPDPSFEKDFNWIDKELDGHASLAASSANDSTWLVRKMSGGPVTYYLFDRDEQKVRELFSDHPALADYPMAERHARTVTTRDGLQLPVQVYLPADSDGNKDGVPNKPLPTILYVHGGPWVGAMHWNNWFHLRNFQLLANRGYVVINTEFRSTTGLGKAMTAAGDKEWGGKMHFDLIDIADWAVDQGLTDPDALGMWGWSYGGYATNAALVYAPEMFQAGISMYGPSDLEAFCKLPGIEDSPLWINRVGNVKDPQEVELLRQHSPINFVNRAEAPLLLTTGSKDERVPQEQVDRMAQAYNEAGKEVIYFYYPEEVHDYREPGSWISFWAIAEQFLALNLGGDYQEIGTDLEKGQFEVNFGQSFIENLK